MNPIANSPEFTKQFNFFQKHWINKNRTLLVPQEFATIPAALNYLSDKIWAKSTKVTLKIGAGIHDVTSYGTMYVTSDITITGEPPVTKTITSLVSTTGSTGNWLVTYNVSDITNLTVGMLVNIQSTTGTGDFNYHRGCWEITALPTSTRITVKNTNRKATFTSTVTAGTIIIPLTQLKTTSNIGIFYFKNCSVELSDIAFKGNSAGPDYTNTAINLNDSILVPKNIGINSFYCGVNSINQAGVHAPIQFTPYILSISNCQQGILGQGIKLAYRSIQVTGCGQLGLLVIVDHCEVSGSTSCFLGNTIDIQAQANAYVHVAYTIYETTSPAVNTVGNGNSYISTF